MHGSSVTKIMAKKENKVEEMETSRYIELVRCSFVDIFMLFLGVFKEPSKSKIP